MAATLPAQDWVLWDGECGFCRRSVNWLKRHDREDRFRAVPYQEAPSPPMTPDLYRACDRAVHVVRPDGVVLRAGRAVLYLLECVGWGWRARLFSLPPFIWAVELGYAIVAKNRRFFSRFLFTHE